MSISGVSCGSKPDVTTDPGFQKLESQITDWKNCPTTPQKIKDEKIQNLQGKEDVIRSAAEQKAQMQRDTGKGQLLDIAA